MSSLPETPEGIFSSSTSESFPTTNSPVSKYTTGESSSLWYPYNFSSIGTLVSNKEEEGVIQVFSTLPKSYPGFSILTEDLGMILGYGSEKDICKCGMPGKYFLVNGRLLNTEIRGCSNTYNR